MQSANPHYPVIIAGGGPVGLLLAILLLRSDISCRVLEKRTQIDPHSKSIGIHPISLEILTKVKLAESFLNKGVRIGRGHAYAGRRFIGTLSFQSCPPPYPCILSVPQNITEKILEDELRRLDPGCLIRGAEVQSIREENDFVELTFTRESRTEKMRAVRLAGCDGKGSIVRTSAGIRWEGKRYPDTYIMADLPDHTSLGSDAAIYLHPDGLVESFPLPRGRRRWVVKTDRFVGNPSNRLIRKEVAERVGIELREDEESVATGFGVQHFIASDFSHGRLLLAGDAAHVISPIGGQGMNLGWLTARNLALALAEARERPVEADGILQTWSSDSRKMAKQAARRAEMNMRLGRRRTFPFGRNLMVRMMINTPLCHLMTRVFTMRGLGRWPV